MQALLFLSLTLAFSWQILNVALSRNRERWASRSLTLRRQADFKGKSKMSMIVRRDSSSPQSSGMSRFWDRIRSRSPEAGVSRWKSRASEGALSVRQVGEGALTGAALGLAHAELKDGLDFHKIPIDGVVGLLGIVAAVVQSDEPYAHDLRNIGTAGATVFAFRKTYDLMAAKKAESSKLTAGAGAHGEYDLGAEDPVIAAARNL